MVEFVGTYRIAWVRRAEEVEFGVFLGSAMEVVMGAGGGGTFSEGSVRVSWQEGVN